MIHELRFDGLIQPHFLPRHETIFLRLGLDRLVVDLKQAGGLGLVAAGLLQDLLKDSRSRQAVWRRTSRSERDVAVELAQVNATGIAGGMAGAGWSNARCGSWCRPAGRPGE